MLVLGGIAQAATVITFGGLGEGNYDYVTDKYEIASVWGENDIIYVSDTLSDGTSMLLTNNQSCSFWGGTADGTIQGTWTNAEALTEVNAAMGTSYTASDFSSTSTMYYTAPGNGGSRSTLSFDFGDAAVGSTLTMYVTSTGHSNTLTSFDVTGLADASIAYAANNGNGFSESAVYSEGAKTITMFKVTGTITDEAVALAPGVGVKTGFQTVAYSVVAPAVPEPTTATLSLLALAGLAARRRRASR